MEDEKTNPPPAHEPDEPEVTSKVPLDEKITAPEPGDVRARVEAAVEAAQTEVERRTTDPLLGALMGDRFKVTSRIGTGGMGVVYKARQVGMDRWVAVKVLLKELTYDEKVIKRFKIEALAASRLSHPNTIRIYDFGIAKDDVLYIAMEFLDGASLENVLRNEAPLSARRTLHVIKQIASSLAEAHDKGIVHRDLKPDNIFLINVDGDRDFVKVLDFGVAKLREADRAQGTLTQAGVIFGTPRYMAPEQCRSQTVDHRADLYALGVIGYECLTGNAPFEADSPLAILMKHVQEEPKPLSQTRPDVEVPEELDGLIMKCLAKRVEDRFASAKDLLAEAAGVEARMAGRYEKVVYVTGPRKVPAPGRDPSEAKTSMDTVSVLEDHEKRRRKWPIVAGSAAVALLAAGVIWAFGSGGGETVKTPVTYPGADAASAAADAFEAVDVDAGKKPADSVEAVPGDSGSADPGLSDTGPADEGKQKSKKSKVKRKNRPGRGKVVKPPEEKEPAKKPGWSPKKSGDLKETPF